MRRGPGSSNFENKPRKINKNILGQHNPTCPSHNIVVAMSSRNASELTLRDLAPLATTIVVARVTAQRKNHTHIACRTPVDRNDMCASSPRTVNRIIVLQSDAPKGETLHGRHDLPTYLGLGFHPKKQIWGWNGSRSSTVAPPILSEENHQQQVI